MDNVKTIKQALLLPIKPIFPYLRTAFIRFGLIKQPEMRQPFVLGRLREGATVEEFRFKLRSQKFFREKMAFIDPDEILGMRKLDPKNPTYQYHVRVYRDNEVRGHYEKTPEDFPIDHFREVGFGPRNNDFMKMFGAYIEPIATPIVLNPEKRYHKAPLQYLGPVRAMEKDVAR